MIRTILKPARLAGAVALTLVLAACVPAPGVWAPAVMPAPPGPPGAVIVQAPVIAPQSTTGASPAQMIGQLEASLTAADQLALAYGALTRCGGNPTPAPGALCSTRAKIAIIKSLEAKAFALVKTAEFTAASGSPTFPADYAAAQQAIVAYQAVTSALAVR